MRFWQVENRDRILLGMKPHDKSKLQSELQKKKMKNYSCKAFLNVISRLQIVYLASEHTYVSPWLSVLGFGFSGHSCSTSKRAPPVTLSNNAYPEYKTLLPFLEEKYM